MRVEIFDIDGTLTYVHGDIEDKTNFSTYAYWPLITNKFAKDKNALKKMIAVWEESMKTEQDQTGSSRRMMQAGIDTFPEDVIGEMIRQCAKEITLQFIEHDIIRKEAIAYLLSKTQQGIVCILSTGSYQDGAIGFVDALIEKGLLTEQSRDLLFVTGAMVDWDKKKLTHVNVRERKLVGIEMVMQKRMVDLMPFVKAVYADDPWINDRDILAIAPREKSYVIQTAKNKNKLLPNGYTLITWKEIIEQSIKK